MDIRAINTENRIRKVIGEPKRTMYNPKVPKELLSRMLILIVIIIGGISLYLYIKYDYSEKATR